MAPERTSVAADRLRRFDISRTSTGDEEVRVRGPDHYVVEAIVSHQLRAPGEYDFFVLWKGYDEVSPGVLCDLNKLPLFRQYCKAHGISKAAISRQIQSEAARAELPNQEELQSLPAEDFPEASPQALSPSSSLATKPTRPAGGRRTKRSSPIPLPSAGPAQRVTRSGRSSKK